jgi:predicted alpha/beta hydrolase family esterase
MKEFIHRFCTNDDYYESEVRSSYRDVLEQLFGHSIERGAKSIFVGGSFVTAENEPEDLDCIVVVPNDSCIPTKNEILTVSGCKLDIIYITETNNQKIYRLMNLMAKDRCDLEVGLIEINLSGSNESGWTNFLGTCSFEELMEERLSYYNRHFITGSEKRGLLVTIHGIRSHGEWNHELAPVACVNNWIFCPFYYGHVSVPLFDESNATQLLTRFRYWINQVANRYGMKPTIIAHSFGTFLLGKYIAGFNYAPPIKFGQIVLAGSILTRDFDWITCFKKQSVASVFNIVSPNDPYVPYIDALKFIHQDKLFGKSGTEGFIQNHERIGSEVIEIYDHSNMLMTDVFEKKILEMLNIGTFSRE